MEKCAEKVSKKFPISILENNERRDAKQQININQFSRISKIIIFLQTRHILKLKLNKPNKI